MPVQCDYEEYKRKQPKYHFFSFSVCENGTYVKNNSCVYCQTHCRNGDICNKLTGRCDNGCANHWSGNFCQGEKDVCTIQKHKMKFLIIFHQFLCCKDFNCRNRNSNVYKTLLKTENFFYLKDQFTLTCTRIVL